MRQIINTNKTIKYWHFQAFQLKLIRDAQVHIHTHTHTAVHILMIFFSLSNFNRCDGFLDWDLLLSSVNQGFAKL